MRAGGAGIVSRCLGGPILLTVALASAPVIASSTAAPDVERAVQAQFSAKQAVEQRVQDIGWRLVTGNAKFCDNAAPAIGLQLHDMASYSEPEQVRALLGLAADFSVLSAAAGSPAATAGLVPNNAILAIDGEDPNAWPAKEKSDWRRSVRAHDLIDARLASDGEVTLALENGESKSIAGTPACPSRFELGGEGKRAFAEGRRVVIERDFPGLDYAEDEFAAAVAHELAHNLLRHRDWLDREGRRQGNVRLTEREADRLMPWLLANAGFDPSAATRFMQRWGPRHSGGIFRKRTHDGWDERLEFIEAEIGIIEQRRGDEGQANWRAYFVREIERN